VAALEALRLKADAGKLQLTMSWYERRGNVHHSRLAWSNPTRTIS